MKIFKEIKTDFGKNVKYYRLPATKGALSYKHWFSRNMCNACTLKVVTWTNSDGRITSVEESKYYAYIGSEDLTDLEVERYRNTITDYPASGIFTHLKAEHAILKTEQNAKLIAAAPKLLECLEYVVSWLEDANVHKDIVDNCKKTIQNATL